jgi:hypothetical protein
MFTLFDYTFEFKTICIFMNTIVITIRFEFVTTIFESISIIWNLEVSNIITFISLCMIISSL